MRHTVSQEDFAQLVRQHARHVLDFTERLLGNRQDAEEAAQDVFVKAYRSLSAFRGDAAVLTWLLRIAYHEAMNRLRQRRPYTVDIGEAGMTGTAGLQAVAVAEADDGLSTGQEERISLLEEAVGLLPPDDQLLLHLYYYDDRPLRDIAYIMDAEPNALGVRLYRIRKKLQTMIKQREDE